MEKGTVRVNKQYLYNEIQEFVVNTGWTHKIQICQADLNIIYANRLKWIKIILASLTSVGIGSFALKLAPNHQEISIILPFLFSVATTLATTLDKENNYKVLAEQNKTSAHEYFVMRNKAIELLYKSKCSEGIYLIEKEFFDLKKEREQSNPKLPYTSAKSVNLARVRLKEDKDNIYANDKRFFIPEDLLCLGETNDR